MKHLLITGASGFIGRNLCSALRRLGGFEILEFGRADPADRLSELAQRADLVFHLAGVNRPQHEDEFKTANADLTRRLCQCLAASGRPVPVVLASSTQAELANAYGKSKRLAEDAVLEYHDRHRAPVYVYRLPNIFGKWSRPNYNSVVATFCHNLSRGLPVQISDRANILRLVYIDDVVRAFIAIAAGSVHDPARTRFDVEPVYSLTLGELHEMLVSFQDARSKSMLPDLSKPLVKHLFSTYLSFNDAGNLAYPVELKTDDRGWLFELLKSQFAGQVFVSKTRPGITRGNHYHDTKVEKFCVIQGEGIIRFRHVLHDNVLEYPVDDRAIRVVDIPPGYTHSIENVGASDMITLFWANEVFDPQHPDTFFVKVKTAEAISVIPEKLTQTATGVQRR